jgi:hypothetical protein
VQSWSGKLVIGTKIDEVRVIYMEFDTKYAALGDSHREEELNDG